MLAKTVAVPPVPERYVAVQGMSCPRSGCGEAHVSDTQIVELALAAVSSPFAHGASV